MSWKIRCVLLCVPALLAGCATAEHKEDALATAVTTPLSDLNLVRKDIPEVLRQAHERPYRTAATPDCTAMRDEVDSLDIALGPDIDAPPEDLSRSDRLGRAAGNAVVKAVTRTAEGVIPMRGWVRQLSGAERRQDEIRTATQAGMVRRAFIKGMLALSNCPSTVIPPTAPTAAPAANAVPAAAPTPASSDVASRQAN